VVAALPLVAFEPLQPPVAVHDTAFVVLHVSVAVPPPGTLVGFAVSVTVGADTVGGGVVDGDEWLPDEQAARAKPTASHVKTSRLNGATDTPHALDRCPDESSLADKSSWHGNSSWRRIPSFRTDRLITYFPLNIWAPFNVQARGANNGWLFMLALDFRALPLREPHLAPTYVMSIAPCAATEAAPEKGAQTSKPETRT
jgi:hypothetical protein